MKPRLISAVVLLSVSSVAGFGVAGVPAHGFDRETAQALTDYYTDGPLCSTARIERLQFQEQALVVSFNIDARWANALAKADPGVRQRWFALHCPVAGLTAVNLPEDTAIYIRALLPSLGEYVLGCVSYNRARLQRIAEQEQGIRHRIDVLLNRLGMLE